jgi:hypothetical protein
MSFRRLHIERLELRRLRAAVDLDLLFDVNSYPLASDSNPRDFVSADEGFYFTAGT